jgi:hypothetical protein
LDVSSNRALELSHSLGQVSLSVYIVELCVHHPALLGEDIQQPELSKLVSLSDYVQILL